MTLKQASEILGVTKNQVCYYVKNRLPSNCVYTVDGVRHINEDTVEQIRTLIEENRSKIDSKIDSKIGKNHKESVKIGDSSAKIDSKIDSTSTEESVKIDSKIGQESVRSQADDELITALKGTIDLLKDQLNAKDLQIAKLTETVKIQAENLKAEQILHADTKKQLTERSEPAVTEDPSDSDPAPTTPSPEPTKASWLKRRKKRK